MGLHRIREDSVKELKKRKTVAELQAENEQLKQTVVELNEQLTNTELALVDVYEMIAGGGQNG